MIIMKIAERLFDIIVDRIEGNYAICEMPDETMCDIELSYFPDMPNDREWYKAFIDIMGNVNVVRKIVKEIPTEKKHKLSNRFIRFT